MEKMERVSNAKKWSLVVALGGVLAFNAVPSFADSYDINCEFKPDAPCSMSQSFGTVTITDNGDSVDITVDLVGAGIHKVQGLFLNYDDALFSNASAFMSTLGANTVDVDENAQQADGYNTSFYDLSFDTPNNQFEPLSFTLSLAGTNLDPTNFAFTDNPLSLTYGAVHIGNYGGAPGTGGGDSIWVGFKLPNGPGPGPGAGPTGGQIPEPATVLLFGTGLAGLGLWRLKNKR